MASGREDGPGGSPPSEEGASSATPASPERGRRRASRQEARSPYSLSQRILQAFEESGTLQGLSLAALRRQLAEGGCPVPRRNSRLRRELNGLVSHGFLTRVAAGGASDSFRVRRQAKRAGQAEPGGKKTPAAAAKKTPRSAEEGPEEAAAAREEAQECAEESCSQPREEAAQ